jgi:hypothetical protein
MKKTLKLLVPFSVFLSCLVVTGLYADDEQEVPEEIVINNEGYKTNRKGPVTFTHLDHVENYDVTCQECHHEYEEGKNIWEEGDYVNRCAECHDMNESDGEVKNLRLSFHMNCKTCHKKAAEEGISEDAPYKKCSGCHEK